MFKLIATIIVTLNGQPQESLKAVHKLNFENQAACEAFKDSESNTVALGQLDAQILKTLPAGAVHSITAKCEPDDSI